MTDGNGLSVTGGYKAVWAPLHHHLHPLAYSFFEMMASKGGESKDKYMQFNLCAFFEVSFDGVKLFMLENFILQKTFFLSFFDVYCNPISV